jgi:hypothetical protein
MVTQSWWWNERVLVTVGEAGLVERRARVGDVLSVGLRPGRLDRQLRRGVPPESGVALALRAARLVRPAARRELVLGLRQVTALADRPPSPAGVTAFGARVRAVREDLLALADRLASGGPVSAYGVAVVRALLTDGAGPLYRGRSPDDLRALVRQARTALDRLAPAAEETRPRHTP